MQIKGISLGDIFVLKCKYLIYTVYYRRYRRYCRWGLNPKIIKQNTHPWQNVTKCINTGKIILKKKKKKQKKCHYGRARTNKSPNLELFQLHLIIYTQLCLNSYVSYSHNHLPFPLVFSMLCILTKRMFPL